MKPVRKCFKEWAIVCGALASGRQIVILRKGGLLEERTGFELRAREFLLFPTEYHQSASKVLSEPIEPLPTGRITHAARVEDCRRVTSLEALRRLRPFHVYADRIVEERFHRWKNAGVHAMIVRVSELKRAVDVPAAEDCEGCRSWFDLSFDVTLSAAAPVLSDAIFVRQRARIVEALGAES